MISESTPLHPRYPFGLQVNPSPCCAGIKLDLDRWTLEDAIYATQTDRSCGFFRGALHVYVVRIFLLDDISPLYALA